MPGATGPSNTHSAQLSLSLILQRTSNQTHCYCRCQAICSTAMKAVRSILTRRAQCLCRADLRARASHSPVLQQSRQFQRLSSTQFFESRRTPLTVHGVHVPRRVGVRTHAVEANVVEPSTLTADGAIQADITTCSEGTIYILFKHCIFFASRRSSAESLADHRSFLQQNNVIGQPSKFQAGTFTSRMCKTPLSL